MFWLSISFAVSRRDRYLTTSVRFKFRIVLCIYKAAAWIFAHIGTQRDEEAGGRNIYVYRKKEKK